MIIMMDFCFDTGPLLFVVENDELIQLEGLNSILLIHTDNCKEVDILLRSRLSKEDINKYNSLKQKWKNFLLKKDKIKNENNDNCKINRKVIEDLCNIIELKVNSIEFRKRPKIIIKTKKYHDPKPNLWIKHNIGNEYIITNDDNYSPKKIPQYSMLELESADFSAFLLAYARCFHNDSVETILVTNEIELYEFAEYIDKFNYIQVPMLINYSFRETHNISNLINGIKKFLYWKEKGSKIPKNKTKYWQKVLRDTNDIINNIKSIMTEFAYRSNSSEENVHNALIKYMQDIDEEITKHLNFIKEMERKVMETDTEIILKRYFSILNCIESKLNNLNIGGHNIDTFFIWVKTAWNTN